MMQNDNQKTKKDVILEGVRFTPRILEDVPVDREKLLSEPLDDTIAPRAASNLKKPNAGKALSIPIRILGLGIFGVLFFAVEYPALKAGIGVGFTALLISSIFHVLDKDPDNKSPIDLSGEDLIKYGGYVLLIAGGIFGVYLLIKLIAKYIIWIILIIVFIAWIKDK